MTGNAPDRLEAIRLAAQAEFARAPKVRAWWVDAAILVGVNLVTGLGLSATMSVTHGQHSSEAMRWVGAVSLLVVAGFGAVAAVRPGWQRLRQGLVLFAICCTGVLLIAASGEGFFGGAACGAIEVATSVLPVLASLTVLSKFAPDPLRTLVGGLAAGAGGVFMLHLHCPNGSLAHLAAFHLVPWLLVSGVAVALRRLVRSSTWAP